MYCNTVALTRRSFPTTISWDLPFISRVPSHLTSPTSFLMFRFPLLYYLPLHATAVTHHVCSPHASSNLARSYPRHARPLLLSNLRSGVPNLAFRISKPATCPGLAPTVVQHDHQQEREYCLLIYPSPLSSRVPIHLSLPPWPLLADALYANDLLLYPFPPFPFLPHPPLRNATPSDSGNYAMIGGGVPRIGARPGDSAATSITNEIAYDITPNASQYSLPAVGAVLSVG